MTTQEIALAIYAVIAAVVFGMSFGAPLGGSFFQSLYCALLWPLWPVMVLIVYIKDYWKVRK